MIDKQFFDTFGIKPKKGCTAYDRFTEEEADAICNDKCAECLYLDNVYPQITDHILLKLICYLSRYGLDLVPKHTCFETIDQLKEHVLKCALGFKIAFSVPILYSQDLQELFKEYNNERAM